jgi:hypothetical protein|eukprot:COSAG06_NODE_104_length_23856_cov_6.259629_9_plen_34_part_00
MLFDFSIVFGRESAKSTCLCNYSQLALLFSVSD